MDVGVSIAQAGQLAESGAVRAAAHAAEEGGYASVWAFDRLLAAVDPRTAYPATADGLLPPEQATNLDPLAVLALAAGVTERIRLGTNVLVVPWYRPVLLARSLATLDRLSDGRLTIGLGLGWSFDEFEAVDVAMQGRGARLEETLDVLDAVWANDPVSFDGAHCRIAPSRISAKPVQRPRPPILLASYGPVGFDRIARRADGWTPAGLPVEALAAMWAGIREAAAGYGRDPETMSLVVRANIQLSERPLDGDRASYYGSIDQVAGDLRATAAAGADEVILALSGDPSLEETLDAYGQLSSALELASAAV